MARIACGRMMRSDCRRHESPSAAAASCWPWSIDRMPPRMISAENAAWLRLSPITATAKTLSTEVVPYWANRISVNGTPISTVGER